MNIARVKMRYRIIALTMVAAWCVLIGRLFFLQVASYDEYKQKTLDNITRETTVSAARGTIYDRNGVVLAENKTVERVFISPIDISGEQERQLIAEKLSEILDVEYDKIYEKTGKVKRKDETIKKNVDKKTADKVRAFVAEYELNSVHTVTSSKRYYPHGNLLSHVLGFTGSDGQGLYGVEYQYDKYLTGTSGKIISAKNGLGMDMPYKYESFVDATDGCDVYLTIDYNLQLILEHYLEEALLSANAQNRVTGVMMDPYSGQILAMATKPDFDCNSPYTLDEASEKKLAECGYEQGSEKYLAYKSQLLMTMWTNKAVNDLYEPGSTFKTVTCSVAIEEGIATETTPYHCPGYHMVDGYGKIRCHKTSGHGSVTFAQGLQKSCNPVMMITAAKIGEEKFYDYFESFGFKEKTGVDLPGEALTYCHSFKNFHNTELAVYSFGQTFKTTAIRQLTSVCAVSNGGNILTPHVVSQINDSDGKTVYRNDREVKRKVISDNTSSRIMDILEKGVSDGIGAVNAYVPGYKVAAKTGTSEKKDKLGADGTYSLRVGSCVTIAPADDPKLALIVIVDEPDKSKGRIEGSFVAAPYNSKIFSEALPYMGIEPEYSEKDEQSKTVQVPGCLNLTVSEATKLLKKQGIRYQTVGDGNTVIMQTPRAGSSVLAESGVVILYTGTDEAPKNIKVPDLTGMTYSEARTKLKELNLNIHTSSNITKDARVFTQSPSPGTMVSVGTVVDADLRTKESDG